MGLLTTLFEKRAISSNLGHLKDPGLSVFFGNRATSSGQNVTPDTALQVSAVYACVRVLAETLAALPLVVYERTEKAGKNRAFNHPRYRLLHDRPNQWQTSFEFREMMMGHILLRGNAYAEIVQPVYGEVTDLIPLHPDRVTVYLSNGKRHYWYQPQTGSGRWIDNMFHLCGFSTDGLIGVNPIQLHRESIGLAMATEEHGARLFSNGAKMGGILMYPGKFKSADTGRAVAGSFDEASSGANAHKTVLLEEGMKWQQITMNSEDAQFLETRNYQVEDIARIFRVPPVLIGYSDKASTYASAEQFFLSFVTHTMTPWFVRWEQAIQRDLINEGDQLTYFAEFLINGLLRGDSQARSEFYTKMFNIGAYSQNDIRAKENENPIEGGDKYFVPLNMVDTAAPPVPAADQGV